MIYKFDEAEELKEGEPTSEEVAEIEEEEKDEDQEVLVNGETVETPEAPAEEVPAD